MQQTFVIRNGRREIGRIALDMDMLVRRAEVQANGKDPIATLSTLIGAKLADHGFRLEHSEQDRIETECARALARERWPVEIDVQASLSEDVRHDHRGADVPINAQEPPMPTAATPDRHNGRRQPTAPPSDLFEREIIYPDEYAKDVYERLHGLDDKKERLGKEAVLLTQPRALEQWSRKHHARRQIRALESFNHGTPLLVFAGDVGTGKTALAESFADAVARNLSEPVHLLRMSIKTRGSGIVGEMTQLISGAFRAVEERAGATGQITVLLLDEADALAESRETAQMHHEDRAGVNALIQGVDRLRGSGLPILVIFCTNRLSSLDPAIRRRAADVLEFTRPNDEQRRAFLRHMLGDLDLEASDLEELVRLTGPRSGRDYGFTYSDLSDRLVRSAVLEAFPEMPLNAAILKRMARDLVPTRPFLSETA